MYCIYIYIYRRFYGYCWLTFHITCRIFRRNIFTIFSRTGAGLFRRVILMSGTALSPWALVRDPAHYAHQAATQLSCAFPSPPTTHLAYEKLLHCIRNRSVEQILKVRMRENIAQSIHSITY